MNNWAGVIFVSILSGVISFWGASIRIELRKLNKKHGDNA